MKQKFFRLMLAMLSILLVGGTLQAGKVHTLGDSTMAPYDENTTGTRGWGMYFGNFLTNGWTSVNYAKGGRDSRGGYEELWQNAKNNVEPGDYVLIQFAHNDTKFDGMDNLELQEYFTGIGDAASAAKYKSDGRGTTPSTTYRYWLTQIVNAVKEKQAIPVLVSAVCRCSLSNGVIGRNARHDLGGKYSAITPNGIQTGLSLPEDDHTMDYTYQMKQLATELGVQFIDMTDATAKLYQGYGTQEKLHDALFDKGPNTTDDNTHYNLTGALTAARLCAQLMKEAGILSDNIVIPTDLSFNPASAELGDVYVGQSATKELTVSGLGLDPATGSVSVTASEGFLLSVDKQNWQTELSISYENGTLIKTIYAKVNVTSVGVTTGTVTATLGNKSAESVLTVSGIELGGGDPFTATWALTSDDNAVVEGNATAAAAKVEGMVKYANNAQQGLMVSTSDGGAWVKAEDDSPNQYVQFTLTAPDGMKLDVNRIVMKIGGRGGGGMKCHAYYSTDGFVTRTTFYAPASMSSGVMNDVEATPVVKLEEGDQLQIRIYPWYTGNATGKWLCIQDVQIGGQAKDASGVNIPGTITYTLDKGGLADNDDAAVVTPNELNAGFAAKKWAYEGSNEKVVIEGTTFQGAAGNTPMMQLRYTGSSSETLSTVADDDCTVSLTLTPEDGFSFIPSKVSFLAGKFNSGNPHLTFAVESGETKLTLEDNVELNRSKTNPLADPSQFVEELSGITATADAPLKLKFSFLNVQGTRSAGIGNLVIEGTLVGAAVQTTKYALVTQVVPDAEAGSITRDPDLETYKEGSKVVLKATKNFGYRFKEWQDANGTVVSTDAETTVTMDAEKTMKAVFEAVPVYKVSTQVTNADERELGSITLIPNDHNGQYEAGTKIRAVANESPILKFLSWTDDNENANGPATRELTVNGDMTLVASYEVQDFVAVFDASNTASYAYATTAGYPFSADVTWDNERAAKSSVVRVSDGSLVYTNADGSGTPVIRNRQQVVLSGIDGLYQNGYRCSDIAFQYQFATKGFTAVTFTAEMAAKNMAHKNWKALISTNGTDFSPLGEGWEMTANTPKPVSFQLPAEAIGQEQVVIRITGDGEEMLSSSYQFDKTFDGLDYTAHSECGVGNVFILGDAVAEADEQAPVVTATVPAQGATDVSASGKITISFDERIEYVAGAAVATLTAADGTAVSIMPSWSNRSVSYAYSGLDYGTQYTFTLPAGSVQDRSGNLLAKPLTISFTTMNRPAVEAESYDVVVSTAEELSAAIEAANTRSDKTQRYRIFLKKGTYQLPQNDNETFTGEDNAATKFKSPITYIKASNISFIGENRDAVVITNTVGDETYVNSLGQTVSIYERIGYSDVLQIVNGVTGTYFQDLTIKSGIADSRGRNIALNDRGSQTVCKNVCLWGYQDTYVSNSSQGVYYFEDGVIRGRTDFICGSGDVFFNKVNVIMCEKGGYVVAPRDNQKYGYVFKDCTISSNAEGVDGNYYLGRAWTAAAETYFINTAMDVKPAAVGWKDWNNGPTRFAEYNSMNVNGAAIDLGSRATSINGTPNNPVLTDEEAVVIGDMYSTYGDWQPAMLTEQAPVPTDVKLEGTLLSWTGSDYALNYAVCADGDVIAFTTETHYDLSAADNTARRAAGKKQYTVRAANEMGGLSEPSVVATETDGIETVNAAFAAAAAVSVYSLDGKRLSQPQRGLNIIRLDDGTTRKVIVK